MARGQRRTRREQERLRLLERGTEDHYLDTALYDHEYADRDDDVTWYRSFVAQRATDTAVLELGAGTGRITCRLAADGHEIIALDRMPVMLDALRQRCERDGWTESIRPVEGDMRELPLPDASVSVVIAPFNALMHLYTWRDLLACLREVDRVLQPGGALAFDVELPDIGWLTWDPEKRHAVTPFVHPTTGERLVYSTNHLYDAATQICHVRIFYDDAPPPGRKFVAPPKPRKLVHLAHRQIFPEEVRALVDAAGLSLESHTGDFRDISLGPAVQSQVVVCTKASPD
ncbi:MAG: class I SAM-dependent methyltransferase [Deltaproteobacteria bacterium]|nr:class I SAM-dependent methyltransferase [Deltaproteobacteria bacterium]